MYKILAIIIASTLIVNSSCYLTREQYEEIKKVATWDVMPYENFLQLFPNKTYEDISKRVGEHVITGGSWQVWEEPPKESVNIVAAGDPLPTNYDPRTTYPQCFDAPRQQGQCGSCYSFAVGLAFETRICIKSPKRYFWRLAPQYIVSCDGYNYKCRGGMMDQTWTFLENYGTVQESCFPYVSGQAGYVPSCPYNCVNGEQMYKFQANKGSLRRFQTVDQIKQELYANGPVSTGMRTFEDFGVYQGGIYDYRYGRETDPHAVMFIGWGVEGGVNYWIIKNSWGPTWGESGYFRIKMYSVNAPENQAVTSQVPIFQ